MVVGVHLGYSAAPALLHPVVNFHSSQMSRTQSVKFLKMSHLTFVHLTLYICTFDSCTSDIFTFDNCTFDNYTFDISTDNLYI